jgi:hypothetical protein
MAYKMKGPSLYRNSPLKSWEGMPLAGGERRGGISSWIDKVFNMNKGGALGDSNVGSVSGLGKDPKVANEGNNFIENRLTNLEDKINKK